MTLVFFGGKATGGGGGGSEEVEDLKARLASAQAEIEQLDRLARSQTTTTLPVDPGIGGATATTVPGSTAATPTAGSGAATTTVPTGTADGSGGSTYTVKPGDTLRSIAAKLYGKTSLDSCIAKAQTPPITDPTKLQLGQKLTLPSPEPTAPC